MRRFIHSYCIVIPLLVVLFGIFVILGSISVANAQLQMVHDGFASPVSIFPLTLNAGDTVIFETRNLSPGSDPVLHLLDASSGFQVAFDDNSANGTASRLTFRTAQAGEFLLVVR